VPRTVVLAFLAMLPMLHVSQAALPPHILYCLTSTALLPSNSSFSIECVLCRMFSLGCCLGLTRMTMTCWA
jgi:hypothetical protein